MTPVDALPPSRPRQILRRPLDRLAGCVWLPRFIDKTRHHLAGTLDPAFVMPYCHRLATDGVFLAHFAIAPETIITVIRDSAGADDFVAAWFLALPSATTERIDAWNALAPNLGKPGFPVQRGFQFILKTLYGGVPPDPRVDSAFTAIAFDEGFLDEVVPL